MNELLDWVLSTVHSVDPVRRTSLAGLGMLLETSILVGLIVPGDSIVLVASTGVGSVVALVEGVRRADSQPEGEVSVLGRLLACRPVSPLAYFVPVAPFFVTSFCTRQLINSAT